MYYKTRNFIPSQNLFREKLFSVPKKHSTEDLVIENPLSPLLAEMFMENLKQQ